MAAPKMLPARYMQSAEQERSYFQTFVDADVSVEDVLTPAFWGHHTNRIKVGTLIDILRRDNTLDMQVRVTDVFKGGAKVRVLRTWEDSDAAEAIVEANELRDEINSTPTEQEYQLPDVYKVSLISKGAKAGFTVIYKPTDLRVCEAIPLRPDAIKLAIAHAKQIGVELVPATPTPEPEQIE